MIALTRPSGWNVLREFGTVNASILTGPRVTLAMAADGLFWKRAAHVDARRGTPDVALLLQGGLATIWLWFAGGFEGLYEVLSASEGQTLQLAEVERFMSAHSLLRGAKSEGPEAGRLLAFRGLSPYQAGDRLPG